MYDVVGKVQSVNDPTGTYGFSYDNMGRLTGTSTQYAFLTGTFTNSYTYDAASNRTGFTAPDGSTNTYSYDTLNRLAGLANSWAGSFGFSYDALSRRTQITRPNGISTNYSYDSLSRLLSVLHQTGASTIDGAVYTVDAAGNRTSKADQLAGVTSNYGYDAIYQLTQVAQGASTTESYTYDPVGNRLSSLGVSPYSYNPSNEMVSTPTALYVYDSNGNTTSNTDSTGTTSYAWDYENRLTTVTLPGSGGTVTFKYDPFGRRISKSSSAGTSVFAYDGDNLAEETNATGAVIARYSQGQNIDEPLAMSRSGATSYYEGDGLGSVTSLTASNGSLAQSYTYDSFGKLNASAGSLINPFQYTARELDSDTGLYYYRARYYDPAAGRFLSEDPIGFDSGQNNFYDYVGNSPVLNFDPTGLAYCMFIMDKNSHSGYMLCLPKDPRKPSLGFPAASGNNANGSNCKNNPDCAAKHFVGPIPLGTWGWTNRPNSKGQYDARSLEPVPYTGTNLTEGRTGILTHWCPHPFGPSAHPPFCSAGCVTANQANIRALNKLIDSEPGSTLSVLQTQ